MHFLINVLTFYIHDQSGPLLNRADMSWGCEVVNGGWKTLLLVELNSAVNISGLEKSSCLSWNITFNKIKLLISILLSARKQDSKVKFIVNQYHKEWKGIGEAAEAGWERGGMQRGGIKNLLRYILDVSLGIGQTITSGENTKRVGEAWAGRSRLTDPHTENN